MSEDEGLARRRGRGIIISVILLAGSLAWWYLDRDTAPSFPRVPPSLSALTAEHQRVESSLPLTVREKR